MSENEDETFLLGLAMGGDDGLGVSLMEEDEDYDRRKYRIPPSGNELVSRPAWIIQALAVVVLIGITIWLLSLIL